MNRPKRTEAVHPRRMRAYELLAAGVALRAIARELKVKHETVMNWRDSEEGQREIAAFGAKLADARHGVLFAAEKRLAALSARVVDTLSELLDNEDPNVRLRAAATIADRGGLPKTERVELPAPAQDYSDLTDEELDVLRAAQAIRERKGARG